jgi:hypothetical protein
VNKIKLKQQKSFVAAYMALSNTKQKKVSFDFYDSFGNRMDE